MGVEGAQLTVGGAERAQARVAVPQKLDVAETHAKLGWGGMTWEGRGGVGA